MSKKKGKVRPDEAGDGQSKGPGTSKSSGKKTPGELSSPSAKKPKEEASTPAMPKPHKSKKHHESQHSRETPAGSSQEPHQIQQQQQSQGAWGKGPASSPSHRQQQQQQQPQGAWGKGPASSPSHQQQQQQQQPQGAWGRGPPSSPSHQQQQQQQQPQRAWGKGPPSSPSHQQQQQQQQQPQGAWGRGPPSGPSHQQQQQQQQPQRAWGKGPPSGPSHQQQQQQQQPQGAWGRGPPSSPSHQQQQQHQQPQGAWGRTPTPGPPEQQQSQQDPLPGSSKTKSEFRIPKKQKDKTDKEKIPSKKEQTSEQTKVLEFAPRIVAQKKSGRPIVVATNFYPLIIGNPNITVYHYDVVFEPDKPKYLIRTVWNKYMSMMFPGRLAAFDGKNAYSRGPLTNGGSTAATVTVLNTENNREKEFKVSIEEVRRISLSVFQNYRERMLQTKSMKSLPEAEIAVLDIILRNWACDNYIKSGRVFFPTSASNPLTHDLSDKLSMRIGYFQAAFLGYKPYLNFDIAHRGFYKEIELLNVLNNFKNRNTGAIDIEDMNHFLTNVKVIYQLPRDSSSARIFRVNKLVGDANSQSFTKDDGTQQTVANYFETEKKYRLRYPGLPLLWVGPTQRSIYLPMELCRIAPDQVYKGLMSPYETKEMVRNATSNARDRKRDVNSLFQNAKINSTPLMAEFELKVSNEMEKVSARVLNPPSLRTSRNIRVEDGVWRIQDFLEPMRLNRWCILNLDSRVNKQSLMNFQKMLKNQGMEYRMQIADPSREPMNGDPSFASMKKSFSQLKGMEIVFVVISEAKGVYSKVKAICETQEGVLTQCVKSRTLSQDPRKLTTTIQNILLKVNAKLGGKNHCLDRNSAPGCLNGYVMIVGADVTHPSPGVKIPSVAAVTVSSDPLGFQYATSTRVQPKGEMIRDLEEIMSIHLSNFYKIRKNYPEKIIFFRDGVSEGELPKVFTNELLALKKACGGRCRPKITFVIVQKRHHTRFYPTSSADEHGRNFNVPVGTCVDTDIVHPKDLDFYLVSHASILGTARPTRYRLLYDDNQLTDDEIETLAYYLCHLFARCNRSVSYPSPTYNAHLAAARVRAHLEGLNLMGGQDIDLIKNRMTDHISEISPMFFV